jgi:hypothetical protein
MDPKAILPWYPEIDKDLPEAERFTILYSPLDMRDEAQLNDGQIKTVIKGKKSNYEYKINQADVTRLEKSIKGWKNLDYPANHPNKELAGKPAPYCMENIALIPPDIRREYIDFLTGRNRDEGEDDAGEATAA